MSLIDTTDNILMLGAYGWAFVKPIRKLYYNMTITSVSVVVALVVGGIEALGLLAEHFHLQGRFWELVARLNDNFGTLGYFIVALFRFKLDHIHSSLQVASLRSTGARLVTIAKFGILEAAHLKLFATKQK